MIHEAVAAIRAAVSTVMGFSYIPSADSLAYAEELPATGGGYEVGQITYERGLAVLDTTATVPMDVIYYIKRVAGTDTDSAVTQMLDRLANAVQGVTDVWKATYGITTIEVTDARIGPAAFNQALADTDSPYMACRLGLLFTVSWGAWVAPTVTWADSTDGTDATVTATITKSGSLTFSSKSAAVETAGGVTVPDVETWAVGEGSVDITFSHDPYTSYTVTLSVTYNRIPYVFTHTYAATSTLTATWEDTAEGTTVTTVATFTKSAHYAFTSRTVSVYTNTSVPVSNVTTWGDLDATASIVWTDNPIYESHTVTIVVVYNGTTTTLTHTYPAPAP